MSRPRVIKAAKVWLFNRDSGGFELHIETRKGAYVHVHFDVDASEAICAIGKLAPIVAAEIKQDRARHERQRQRLADAWSLADQAIKGESPKGAS